jgi:phosphomannomutase
VAAYLDAIVPVASGRAKDIRIVHTAMHGVGTPLIARAFAAAGFPAPIAVPEQAAADPDFPTVAFPNPEEPGALDLALALANREAADIIIASDPDADRCAVAAPFPDTGWRMLRGDEVGVLLADHLMRRGLRGTYATTVVSSTLLRAMAADRGVGFGQTLTGFKWIVRAADDVVFGYEEALGYAVLPDVVRDKDGISAALLVADLAAELRASGRTLVDRLAELARRYGLYATDQISVRVTDLSQISETMRRLRRHRRRPCWARPPRSRIFCPRPTCSSLAGTTGGWWCVRPGPSPSSSATSRSSSTPVRTPRRPDGSRRCGRS